MTCFCLNQPFNLLIVMNVLSFLKAGYGARRHPLDDEIDRLHSLSSPLTFGSVEDVTKMVET